MKNLFSRGEMSSKMLVSLILVITGFAIIAFIYAQVLFPETIDREVCHQSVVVRGTFPDAINLKDSTPLNCQTKKVCIKGDALFDSGKCEEFTNVKPVTTAKVDSVTEVEKIIAQEVVDCWSMMGQGKVSLFSKHLADYGIGDVYPSCVICSRIAFEEQSLAKKKIDVGKRDVLGYMFTHKVPNQNVSYYEYLAGEDSSAKISFKDTVEIPNIVTDEQGNLVKEGMVSLDVSSLQQQPLGETEELAVLFMQISAPTKSDVWGNIGQGLGLVGGATAVSPARGIAWKGLKWLAPTLCGGPIRGSICGAFALIAVGSAQYNAGANRGVAATTCGDVSSGEEARNGCSVVRTVPYDLENIREYCSVIESKP